MAFVISDPAVVVNNEPIGIVPGSVKYTEGFGEQKMRAISTGNGQVEQVYSQDISTNFSMVKFSVYNDVESIALARSWKSNLNSNLITITGSDPVGNTITRTFNKAALIGDYEVEFSSDSNFELEFTTDQAV